MKIVLDTNCLLVSVQEYSEFFWMWQAFRSGRCVLCYSTEIINEYHEVLSRYFSPLFADTIIEDILSAPNTMRVTVYYKWQLITADPDDNKFVDCAVSANASYIVTNDRHFNALEKIDFPKVSILTLNEFKSKV